MQRPYFSFRDWALSTGSSLIVILGVFVCLHQQCQAQGQLDSQADMSVNPLNYVYWHWGPQNVSLGDFAKIKVPAGYRFTDVHGARNILKAFNNPIPDDLVGILASVSGRWMAILEYAPDGYVKNPDFKKDNTKTVLNQVLNLFTEEQRQSITSLNWQSQPAYDARMHVLQWSFQIVTPSGKIVDQAAAMFGRHGVFQITVAHYAMAHYTVAHDASLTGASPLEQVIGYVSFKDGERYADYKQGDQIAQIGLADLISGENHPQTAGFFSGKFFSGGIEAFVPWIYGGLAFCFLTGGLVVVRCGNKAKRGRARAPVPAPPKRMFDYERFYTDVVRELCRPSLMPPRMETGRPIFINHAKSHRRIRTNRKPQII